LVSEIVGFGNPELLDHIMQPDLVIVVDFTVPADMFVDEIQPGPQIQQPIILLIDQRQQKAEKTQFLGMDIPVIREVW